MKNECKIVADLLPLYAEDMVSSETAEFVSGHIKECEDCRTKLSEFRKEVVPTVSEQPLKTVKREIKHKRRRSILIAALLVLALSVSLFSFLTMPHYLPYRDGLVECSCTLPAPAGANIGTEPAKVGFTFAPEAAGCSVEKLDDPEGGLLYVVSAWYTVWDRLFKDSESVSCYFDYEPGEPVQAVYCENDGTENLILFQSTLKDWSQFQLDWLGDDTEWMLEGPGDPPETVNMLIGPGDPPETVNMMTLPRLVLGYYVIIALVLLAASAVLWLVFRKKRAGRIFKALFLLAIAYLLGHLLIMGPGTISYCASWCFLLIVIECLLLWTVEMLVFNRKK